MKTIEFNIITQLLGLLTVRKMAMARTTATTLVGCAFALSLCASDQPKPQTLEYEMLAYQQTIGKIVRTTSIEGNSRERKSVWEISMEPIGEDFEYLGKSEERWTDSTLNEFDQWIIHNGERWHLNGEHHKGDDLWVRGYQVKSKDDQDLEEIGDLAGMVLSNSVPYAGTILQVAGLFSDESLEGEEAVPRSYYDALSVELEKYLYNLPQWSGNLKIRVFSLDELDRRKVKVVFRGSETIEVPGGEFECKIFHLKHKGNHRTVWVTSDEYFGAKLIKEEGIEDGLEYQLVLKEIR